MSDVSAQQYNRLKKIITPNKRNIIDYFDTFLEKVFISENDSDEEKEDSFLRWRNHIIIHTANDAFQIDRHTTGEDFRKEMRLLDLYYDSLKVIKPEERAELRIKHRELMIVLQGEQFPGVDRFLESIYLLLQSGSVGLRMFEKGALLVSPPDDDLLKKFRAWYDGDRLRVSGEEFVRDWEKQKHEDQNIIDLKEEAFEQRIERLQPKDAVTMCKDMVNRLDNQQKRDREQVAAMLKVLEGNPSFTGEERGEFVHALNELLDRLGVALFRSDSDEPIRLGVRDCRGHRYFRFTREKKQIGGSSKLWEMQIKPRPAFKSIKHGRK